MAVGFADPAPAPLEERIATVMGVINAASAELVALIDEALATDAWQVDGIRSPEHWVAWQCGASAARAASLVATARGLRELPECRRLFQQGLLSEDQGRVIAAAVDAAHDREVAQLAPLYTLNQLRRAVQSLRTPPPEPEPVDEPDPKNRQVAFGYRDDGRWWCTAVLPPDEGALVQTALEAARDAEFRMRHPDAADDPAHPAPADISWADGLVRLAEAALTNLDASAGRPGERYQVYLHVDADAPASAYASWLHLGPSVDAGVRRLITCDAPIRLVLERSGRLVGLSAKQDTVDVKTRKLVEDRDGGCRVHGCGRTRRLHIHHIVHREDRGATTLDNLCALCPAHHRLHHLGHLEISGDPTRPDGLEITTPGGRQLGPPRPRPPGRPPGLPPPNVRPLRPYQHPLGQRADWRWLDWS